MSKNLVIVESPAKSKTIEKYLGSDYKVLSSKGHIRDLATSGKYGFGVDIEDGFKPNYEPIKGKKKDIAELKKEVKNAEKVYLATDPDREGEAISWHLKDALGIDDKDYERIVFNEITKNAVVNSFKNARKIDDLMVRSQETRRILDRIIGFRLSKLMQSKTGGKSAGRVQSVALKLIVDREKEIEKFIPEEYWTIKAIFPSFDANLFGYKENTKLEIKNEIEAKDILNKLSNSYKIESTEKKNKNKASKPPYTTSTMQQDAVNKINFSSKKTMSVAQKLYEGINIGSETVGLITYMRTDSTRISEEARAASKIYIEDTYGTAYYENRYFKTKQGAQDAHEAIRPTYVDLTPERVKSSLTNDQYKLYNLIYNRFIASQMSSAEYDTISVTINAGEYNFKANGQSIKFKGFMKLYVETKDQDNGEDDELLLPSLELNQKLKNEKIDIKQSFTEPPPRYTEASIVKVLEEKGIGRPSTYAPTISTILDRRYIEKEQKQLVPTDLGKIVNKLLVENFSDVINVAFTAKIEEEFDEIAEGKENWKEVISEFYGPFEENVERVEKELEHVQLVEEVSDVPCEKCGRMMVIKYGRYGKFLACPGFPECRNAKPIIETIDVPCPVCGGTVQVKKSRRGRKFYVCENNPESCQYISWNIPKVGEKWEPKEDKPDAEKKKTVKKKVAKKTTSKKKTTKKK